MRINVIGGSGFIGTRLVARLISNGFTDVSIIDKAMSQRFPERTRIADVRDEIALEAAIDAGAVIINLAAEHRDDVTPISLYEEVNVNGARNICAIADRKTCERIIFTSTVAVYGAAELGTGEDGRIAPFNEYGRTKHAAEAVFKAWQAAAPQRALTIVRPTVVFGEQNRGNVYNLLRQIASGRFLMIGSGRNRKSLAYVENVAAFLESRLESPPGAEVFNYIDKPDFDMNSLVANVYGLLGRPYRGWLRLPYPVGYAIGLAFDLAAKLSARKFPISAIRVRKFCLNSVYRTRIEGTGFKPPVPLEDAIRRTVTYEFIETHEGEQLFFTE
jgi:nucleoside-diphosphate-sugar epimerase